MPTLPPAYTLNQLSLSAHLQSNPGKVPMKCFHHEYLALYLVCTPVSRTKHYVVSVFNCVVESVTSRTNDKNVGCSSFTPGQI